MGTSFVQILLDSKYQHSTCQEKHHLRAPTVKETSILDILMGLMPTKIQIRPVDKHRAVTSMTAMDTPSTRVLITKVEIIPSTRIPPGKEPTLLRGPKTHLPKNKS